MNCHSMERGSGLLAEAIESFEAKIADRDAGNGPVDTIEVEYLRVVLAELNGRRTPQQQVAIEEIDRRLRLEGGVCGDPVVNQQVRILVDMVGVRAPNPSFRTPIDRREKET